MPIQPYRTRTFRKIKVRTVKGVKIHYKKRKPKPAHCSKCKKILNGMPRGLPCKIRKLPKSQRRPERMYGGVLCPECLKQHLKEQYLKKSYTLEVGRVCIKIAGREAGKYCVIIDKKDNNVVIDGDVRRKKCNINHLITLEQKLKIKKNATKQEVIKQFKAIGIDIIPKKSKKSKPRIKKQRKQHKKKEKVESKKETKKPEKKVKKKQKKTKEAKK